MPPRDRSAGRRPYNEAERTHLRHGLKIADFHTQLIRHCSLHPSTMSASIKTYKRRSLATRPLFYSHAGRHGSMWQSSTGVSTSSLLSSSFQHLRAKNKFLTHAFHFYARMKTTNENHIFSCMLLDSICRSIRWSIHLSICPSVTLYFFWVFAVFGLTAPAQMIR